MKPISAEDFAGRCEGKLVGLLPETAIYSFALDSREARPGSLFLAIRGERVDGHDYASLAIRNGAVAALVEREIDEPHILVPNLVQALAQFASSKRDEFEGITIGVTGSAGKTSTKELIAAALAPLGRIAKTEGNRNTELTAPLLWAELEGDEAAIVVEMSMRGKGQIAHLASFCKPSVGVITNIGASHAEKVGTIEDIAAAKGELFAALPSDGLAIAWHEEPMRPVLAERANCRVETFGWSPDATATIVRYEAADWTSSEIEVRIGGEAATAKLPFAGRHFALNAAAALLVARRCGVSLADASQSLGSAKLPGMRMQPIVAQGVTYVLDNYNASPPSYLAALATLGELPCTGRRLVVAGEMRELGEFSAEAHASVGRGLAAANVDGAIFFGPQSEPARRAAIEAGLAESKLETAHSLDDVTRWLRGAKPGDVVLVKGSRALELEKAVEPLLPGEVAC